MLIFTGIRSASFQGNILTIGTGVGMLMFYDHRAGKYLESSINSSRTVVLKASRGYVVIVNSLSFDKFSTFLLHYLILLFSFSSFPMKNMWMDFNRLNTLLPFTLIVMMPLVFGCFLQVALYLRIYMVIMLDSGNDNDNTVFFS